MKQMQDTTRELISTLALISDTRFIFKNVSSSTSQKDTWTMIANIMNTQIFHKIEYESFNVT